MAKFFAIVTDDTSGEVLAQYTLADTDTLDCALYARRYANENGFAVDWSDGYVFKGCADFSVTLTEQPGAVHCWSTESYFIASNDD